MDLLSDIEEESNVVPLSSSLGASLITVNIGVKECETVC